MPYRWETSEIERATKKALRKDLGKRSGEDRFSKYMVTRSNVVTHILPEIAKVQPSKTDHGPDHVRDVLDNAWELLGREGDKLNGVELYCLILSILFHDVGNVINREDHRNLIAHIYDYARPDQRGSQDEEEKRIILRICEAHCGKGADGSSDTLKHVPERSKIERREVRPNILAPILRFADELAEGPQRTSHYMIQTHRIPEDSILFHNYANCSNVDIDRKNGRIRLTYHIPLSLADEQAGDQRKNDGTVICIEKLEDFLCFVYRRIEKLHQERLYTKHYCSLLDPFKRTTVTFNFWYEGKEIPVDLQQVEMSDLVVPGNARPAPFEKYDDLYQPSKLIKNLEEAIHKMRDM